MYCFLNNFSLILHELLLQSTHHLNGLDPIQSVITVFSDYVRGRPSSATGHSKASRAVCFSSLLCNQHYFAVPVHGQLTLENITPLKYKLSKKVHNYTCFTLYVSTYGCTLQLLMYSFFTCMGFYIMHNH